MELIANLAWLFISTTLTGIVLFAGLVGCVLAVAAVQEVFSRVWK